MLGKIEEKRGRAATEYDMVRQHPQLNGREFEQTPGDSEGNWHAAVYGITKSQMLFGD